MNKLNQITEWSTRYGFTDNEGYYKGVFVPFDDTKINHNDENYIIWLFKLEDLQSDLEEIEVYQYNNFSISTAGTLGELESREKAIEMTFEYMKIEADVIDTITS